MLERSDVVYLYDGSYEGLLCCIFESYAKKELPLDIMSDKESQWMLCPYKRIDTDRIKADRVKAGIRKKGTNALYNYVEWGYYTCHPHKERLILDFVRLGLVHGKNTLSMLTNDVVNDLLKAVKALTRESHQLKGFVRFSIYDQIMAAVIEPKNFVLPLLEPHFCDRYSNETFVIYDVTHRFALLYKPRQSVIVGAEDFKLPDAGAVELKFRSLWKLFYDTIAIEERYHPEGRMSHMQKRFWNHLTEMNASHQPFALKGKTQEGLRKLPQEI